jgi:hypothetical protein
MHEIVAVPETVGDGISKFLFERFLLFQNFSQIKSNKEPMFGNKICLLISTRSSGAIGEASDSASLPGVEVGEIDD